MEDKSDDAEAVPPTASAILGGQLGDLTLPQLRLALPRERLTFMKAPAREIFSGYDLRRLKRGSRLFGAIFRTEPVPCI